MDIIMLHNKIRYVVIVLLTVYLAIFYSDYYMAVFLITVVILPFLLFAILSYVYGKLSYELLPIVHVVSKGDNIPITIRIHNPTIFPVSYACITLSYHNTFASLGKSGKQEIYVTIDKRTTTTVSCSLISQYTGNLKVFIQKVRVFDYLKLFSLRKRKPSEIKVAVLPLFYELTEDYLENSSRMQVESDIFSSVRGGDDPSEVSSIREYREGDRPGRIHWKLSIKQNQLMIKEFSDPINSSVVVFADLCIPKKEDILESIDAILECALSLSYSFLLKGRIHYLTWYDNKICACRRVRIVNERDLYEAVDGILDCDFYKDDVDMVSAYFAEYPNDQYTDLFLLTKNVSHKQLDSLLLIKVLDRHLLYINGAENDGSQQELITVDDMPIDAELVRKITDAGMGLFSINSSNIKEDLEGLALSWK
jgi:hypothetical protein